MGHLTGKDIYRRLGRKIDSLTARAPWNDKLYAILKELYEPEEAELIVRMPYGLSTLDQIADITRYEPSKLQKLLDSLCDKGLAIDIFGVGGYRYAISPLIIGIFEFTMMRTRGDLNTKQWAKLFHDYLQDKNTYLKANYGRGQKVSPLRVLPHEDAIDESGYVEILDFEKAIAIVEQARKLSIGICSCRHEKLHVGEKKCDVPLQTCSSFDDSAEKFVKHGFAKEVSKAEMLDNLARAKELGLVLCSDNVKKNISFICHCCGCCCNVLLGISRFGFPNTVVSSNYIARIDPDDCIQCGTCVETCPIGAIAGVSDNGTPEIKDSLCLGCGVCALNCESESLKLVERKKRVYYPEDSFEHVIMQSLEQGTLQNLLFRNPQSITHAFMRGFVGGFLKLPPVKKAIMSDMLRSRFLTALKKAG